MAETVKSIVKSALRLLKVTQSGEEPSASEATDGITAINDIISDWNNQPLMQPAKQQLTQALSSGDDEYTFGTGGDNSIRPVRIYRAYIREASSTVDYPVNIISNEEYSRITFKSVTSSYPYNLYYRNEYPLGVVKLFPVPGAGYTLYLEVQAKLSTYSDVNDSVDLPPGYIKALKYQLSIDISPEYKEPSIIVLNTAREAIANIKRMNSKDKPIMANTARIATGYNDNSNNYWFGTA